MNFEQMPANPAEEQLPEKTAAEKIYESQGLEGPSLDFSRAGYGDRRRVIESNPQAKELYEDVVGIIDTDQYQMAGSHPEDVIGIIGILAKENEWKSYDDVNFSMIRKELEKQEVPLRAQKTKQDVY
jgi:hypothetical protein